MKIIEKPYNFAETFTELCHEVLKDTPLNYFSISRVYKNGTYNALMTDPKWVEHYLDHHYKNTIAQNVKHYQVNHVKDYELWSLSSMYGQSEEMQRLYEDCCIFGYSNGITFVQEYEDCYELYSFSSSCIEGVDQYVIENIDHLRLLTLMIKEKLLNDQALSQEFEKAYEIPNNLPEPSLDQKPKILFKDLKINQFYFNEADKKTYFTKKEILCLIYLVRGCSIKQIADILQLSPRTIETHLNNVKLKSRLTNLIEVRKRYVHNKFIKSLITTL